MVAKDIMIFGLLGYPLGHSFSPGFHNGIYKMHNINAVYKLFEVDEQSLEDAVRGIRALNISGANVTIPYKEKIIDYLDDISDEARRIGAVNTIKNENGLLKGYNTDYYGFKKSIDVNNLHITGQEVFVIGNGGAAKPVILSLLDMGCKIHVFGRDMGKLERLKSFFTNSKCDIEIKNLRDINHCVELIKPYMLVNCTPVGMHGIGGDLPLHRDSIEGNVKAFYDLVYNPLETDFLTLAKSCKCEAISGIDMLYLQALESIRIWTGKKIDYLGKKLV